MTETKTIRKAKTMNLGKGGVKIDYAKVPTRVLEFHKDNKNGRIETTYEFIGNKLIFKAIATPNVDKPERHFNGTALGNIDKEKALEKLETVAVGRALAFAGYNADGEIASSEEMDRYEENKTIIDNSEAMARLNGVKTLVELHKVWKELSADERNNDEVCARKDELKKEFGGVTE